MKEKAFFIPEPTLKGVQNVAGIWFPTQWFDREQRQRLLIKSWFLGCSIYQFEHGDLLKFPSAKAVNCDTLLGWPLILDNGILSSMQLPKKLSCKIINYDLVIVMGNDIQCYRCEDANNIDPANWVDLSEYQLYETNRYLINIVYNELPEFTLESRSFEQILDGKIPVPSPRKLQFIDSNKIVNQDKEIDEQNNHLSQEKLIKKSHIILAVVIPSIMLIALYVIYSLKISSFNTSLGKNLYKIFIFIIVSFFHVSIFVIFIKTIKMLNRIFSEEKKEDLVDGMLKKSFSYSINANELPQVNHSSLSSPSHYKKKSLLNSHSFLSLFSKLSHLFSFRQSNYIETMIKKFEKGDLLNALRYALPINDKQNSIEKNYGTPKPRNKLSISDCVYGDSSSIYLDSEKLKYLKKLYRQSFDTLAKQNKIEEAVFVLVELLNHLEEGIEFLEQHNRYKQAMELAIARNAKTQLCIKLCCLANEWNTAVMLARRDNAFEAVILMLEKQHFEIANKLKLYWAKTLAEKADWLAAIDVIWSLSEYRYLAEQWFNNMDIYDAKAIVKRLILIPNSIIKLERTLIEIKTEQAHYRVRLELANEILKNQQNIQKLQDLLRMMINEIIVDAITYPNELTKAKIAKLITLTEDRTLQIDLPISSLKLVRHKSLLMQYHLDHYQSPHKGHRAIYDMIPLINNQYLLALGEAGIIRVDNKGKQLDHFMIVADKFVVSSNRLQILALAKQDNYYRIHKLDLSTKKTIDLGVVNFQLCCFEFDGINWAIIRNNCLELIDISNKLSVVRRIDLYPNVINKLVIKNHEIMVLTHNAEKKDEILYYCLPDYSLTKRLEIDGYYDRLIMGHNHKILKVEYIESSKRVQFKYHHYNDFEFQLQIEKKQFDNLIILSTGELIALVIQRIDETGYEINLYHPYTNRKHITIDWQSSTIVSCSSIGNEYYFFDKQGRVMHINITENKVTSFSL